MLSSKDRIMAGCADELRAAISGPVALAGDHLNDEGARVWNRAVRRRPAMIAFCKQAEDVQAAVRAARHHGLPLSVRGGGHDWAGRALSDEGLVIDLTGMRDVELAPRARFATVACGALAKDVAGAAGAHNLLAALGNCGGVGMAGLTLGGGYGPLNGTCGLAADNLLAAEVVLADGRRVTASPDTEPELFWALARWRRQFRRRDLPFRPPPSAARPRGGNHHLRPEGGRHGPPPLRGICRDGTRRTRHPHRHDVRPGRRTRDHDRTAMERRVVPGQARHGQRAGFRHAVIRRGRTGDLCRYARPVRRVGGGG